MTSDDFPVSRPAKGALIDFNRPHMTGKELYYIAAAHFNGKLAGDGPFTRRCHAWLERRLSVPKALLTHSCTAALEMAALLLDIRPGDEVIVPSFTFVSSANAFALRGGVPVFVDIRPDTLNMDEKLLEAAVTGRTRAVVPVHYAGVACEMDQILETARAHSLAVVEDAAQALLSSYKGRLLGTLGDIGTLSFHETKNIISGEGGAILVNRPEDSSKAEILREKGTDRSRFFRGETDKYTWRSFGSSFLPGELTAAFLWAQLEEADRINSARLKIWNYYHGILEPLERKGLLRRPSVPEHCSHNAHIYYILPDPCLPRAKVMEKLLSDGVQTVFHYVPLHSSPAGRELGRVSGPMTVTDDVSSRLIRLPLWIGLTEEDQDRAAASLASI
jgi:dTDP-4-amino-4,6-dideoxygalactose transaminase